MTAGRPPYLEADRIIRAGLLRLPGAYICQQCPSIVQGAIKGMRAHVGVVHDRTMAMRPRLVQRGE